MCGIAGYIGNKPPSDRRVRECLDRMGRRGPDAEGSYRHTSPSGRSVCLIHSRLSIIDLDPRSNQPFRIGDQVLISNGELYNYLELRRELEKDGSPFKTTSDTEVLLAHLAKHDIEGLDKCEGMWAFAWYQEKTGQLVLSRDRFGEKPLYYYRDQDGIFFGSEVKFVFALMGNSLPVNTAHLYRYLVNGYKSLYKNKHEFFLGLETVPAANTLVLQNGEPEVRPYWVPSFSLDDSMSFPQAVEQTREALIEAVRLRLRADVPLAFCMSGGIDSNSLISIAKRVLNYDVHGFTIVNTDERYEEQDLVDHAVQELNIRHTPIMVNTSDFLAKLRNLVQYHDAPVYTITYYAHWLLMESIASFGYRISISGTAADELFTGYFDHHNAYLYEVSGQPDIYQTSLANWRQFIAPVVRNPHLQNPQLFIEDPEFRGHIYLNNDMFASYIHDAKAEPFTEERYCPNLLRNRMANELFHESVPVILHEDDLNAMYFSIENRSPFLDRNLFELANRIPTRHLVQQGRTKAVLRESMRGIVPDRILDNPRKVGFNAPIFSFLDITSPEVRRELMDDSPIFEHVRRDAIAGMLEKEFLPNSESKFLFYFICSKMFLEEFA